MQKSLKALLALAILNFATVSSSFGAEKQLVFNLTGSMHGFGDITGPLWVLFDLKKSLPNDKFVVILDERSLKYTKEIFKVKDLETLEKKFHVNFVNVDQADHVPTANYSFELFYGGRFIDNFTDLTYTDDDTYTVISDTMHGKTLDEVRKGESHIYYKPPGIGSDRSGIVNNPDINKFKGQTNAKRREVAAPLFKGTLLEKIIRQDIFPTAQLSFVYGVHNELFPGWTGQTERLVAALEKEYSTAPIIIFTPNSKVELAEALPATRNIYTLAELALLPELKNEAYVVTVGSISSHQFTALQAISTLPIAIEGNSSVSSAMRLNVPFIMFRSPWNAPQLKDVITVEEKNLVSSNFADVYDLTTKALPNFEDFIHARKNEIFYQAISLRIPNYSKKLAVLIDALEQIKSFETESISPQERGEKYIKLSAQVLRITKDEVLAYSMVYDATQRNLIPSSFLQKLDRDYKALGIDTAKLVARFSPNKPNFSTKIEALRRKGQFPKFPSRH
jgi:hypothetical protein